MRLFATGAMNWVMGKALPDDVPIEARMVTRAIERAQGTVEARNAEIRKNVLQYDEVMNEQRKVVYRRRQQILDGADLREDMLESLADAVEHSVEVFCPNDFQEDWDLDGLLADVSSYYPTRFTVEELHAASARDDVLESLLAEAVGYYEERERNIGVNEKTDEPVLREIERTVMMSIIDQRWREHLYEMDYLQEGINLRAMGQRDPLVEWQREGYSMFSQLMDTIGDDFVKYIMHLDVVVEPAETPALRNVQYSAPEDPVQGSGSMRTAAAFQPAAEAGEAEMATAVAVEDPPEMAPVVKSEHEKLGRNDPCRCGSGKKFKRCHGA